MDNLELLKLLKDKKVADSFQFLESCQYKLYLARISVQALEKIINEYNAEESKRVNKVFSDAIETGVGKYISHSSKVDFFGIEIGVTVAIDKLTMEIMGLLHNFFDTFAQWINSCLLGENALPIKRVSLVSVINEVQNYPEYTGQFMTDFINITNTSEYNYIADFNNTLKHRQQLYVENKFDIFRVEGQVNIPNFDKDGRPHTKADVISTIKKHMNFCDDILDDSIAYVKNYYNSADCNYTTHRIYNPQTYLLFSIQKHL